MRAHPWWGLLLVAGCTDVTLNRVPDPPPPPVDNKVTVSGEFCTDAPAPIEFPVKILFVVDVSDSMSITDPPDPNDNNYTARARAVVDVITQLAGVPGVEIGMITFQSSVNDLTKGFLPNFSAADVATLLGYAQTLNAEAGQTNYEGALDATFQRVATDIAAADEIRRGRSKYVVIFISDGVPEPVDPPDNTPESIVASVDTLHKLERERRLDELRIHTVYLSGRTPPQFQQPAIDLLKDMAQAGEGTFRNIGNGEKINFLDIDFTSFRRLFSLKTFMIANRNARPRLDIHEAVDTDSDGLSDDEERRIGTSETSTDTDKDGFHDTLEHGLRTSGFDPLDGADADCRVTLQDPYNRRDDDGDQLLNCEERFLGTNPRIFDSDTDGLPDSVEVLARVSPTADDYFADPDRDGVGNGIEVRERSDPEFDDQEDFYSLRYRYDVRRVEVRDSKVCYTFRVENIALVPTIEGDGRARGDNELMVLFGETPADAPTDFGNFRVACARARFLEEENLKHPASGEIFIPADRFKKPANLANPNDPEIFQRTRDCVVPPSE